MPSQNSVYDNINAVSSRTRDFILDAQIRMAIEEKLDEFKELTGNWVSGYCNYEKTELTYLGNKEILKKHKTAFLCSRKCPADISLDWAREQKEKGNCVISGFHSRIEKDVFDILIKGSQPFILVLARGMKKRWKGQIKQAVKDKRLLIISPFDEKETYITQGNANKRNKIIAEIADEVFVAYKSQNGNLDKLLNKLKDKKTHF